MLVPTGVTTVTSTVPALPAGEVAEMLEPSALTETMVPGWLLPKSTAVAPVNPVPVIVTEVPPVVGPKEGAMAFTTGGGA